MERSEVRLVYFDTIVRPKKVFNSRFWHDFHVTSQQASGFTKWGHEPHFPRQHGEGRAFRFSWGFRRAGANFSRCNQNF
jgi:hypothetical protein